MKDRYSVVARWEDMWFMELPPHSKLLFDFICDSCDEAGIIEVNYPIWQVKLKMTKIEIRESLLTLQKNLLSDKKDKLWVKGHLLFQRKLPLNPNIEEHQWIISRLKSNLQKFNDAPEIKKILDDVEQGSKKSNKKTATNTTFVPPTPQEMKDYFLENEYPEELAEKAWKYYDTADWKDSTGRQVKNWRQKCQSVWFKKENKANNQQVANFGDKGNQIQTKKEKIIEANKNIVNFDYQKLKDKI